MIPLPDRLPFSFWSIDQMCKLLKLLSWSLGTIYYLLQFEHYLSIKCVSCVSCLRDHFCTIYYFLQFQNYLSITCASCWSSLCHHFGTIYRMLQFQHYLSIKYVSCWSCIHDHLALFTSISTKSIEQLSQLLELHSWPIWHYLLFIHFITIYWSIV